MFVTGLVSITFRQLSAEQIIELVRKAGLDSIEWGGDVHVPHGNLERAREVALMTRDAGLEVACYGSYYHCGGVKDQEPDPVEVVETAKALDAPLIRCWAGIKGSSETSPDERHRIIEDAHAVMDYAQAADIDVCFEYHGGSLTDEVGSFRQLVGEIERENFKTLWQPCQYHTPEERIEGLKIALPALANLHVFQWVQEGRQVVRRPLAEGREEWADYLRIVDRNMKAEDTDHGLLLEFVQDDDPEVFKADAATLRSWLSDKIWEE